MSLAHNSQNQQGCERNVQLYERELSKALNQLKNSKSHHTQALKQIQARQLQIVKDRDQRSLLIQAQCMYDNSPILESKRICIACTKRPKSAKASIHASVDGLLRPQANSKRFQRMTFSAYESRKMPPVPCLSRTSSTSTLSSGYGKVVPKIVCFEDVKPVYSEPYNSRSSTPASIRLFDSNLIPDSERVVSP